jgi:hypothetical protein
MRGHKVNYIRYTNNDIIENKISKLEEYNIIDRNIEPNISLEKYTSDENLGNGSFKIDKTVSGQYLINGIEINFLNDKWEYKLTLIKPVTSNTKILNT